MGPDDIDESSEPRPDALSEEPLADAVDEPADDLDVESSEESGDSDELIDDEPTAQQSSADLLAQMGGGVDDDDLGVAPVFRRERPRVLKGRARRSDSGRSDSGRSGSRRSSTGERDLAIEATRGEPSGGYRVRRVRRLVRHVEPWSVLKVCLVFYLCIWGLLVIATRMLWSAADEAGTIGKVESFIEELFALESFTFDSAQIFRIFVLGGLVLVVGGIGITVVLVVLFNLISDLTGGIRFTMVEEETAVRQRRLRRGDVVVETPGTGTGHPPD